MQILRPSIFVLLLGACVVPALASSASAQTCTCAGAGIRSDVAPPALPDYDQPPIPASGYMWTPGYWAWNNADYYWVPGTWVEPPQPGLLWTPGYWGFVDGVYAFNRGYWGPHVGFYGGVSYGFGYGGVGYEGGHWDNGAFFYNRTVNNIGSVHIDNVYEKPVTINAAGAGRASFNGPGGTIGKPTPEEEAAMKETHLPPSDRQIEHARAASMRSDSFASTNHGEPTIAATGKPGAFTGEGVVKAKAAGAAVGEPGAEKPGAVEPKTEEKKPPAGGELKPETTGAPANAPKVEEKRTPAGGELKPETTDAPANAPKVEEKRTPAGGELKPETTDAPANAPKVEEKRTPAGGELKPETTGAPANGPKVEEKRPPAVNKQAAHPAAAAPNKGKCGKPGEPECH